MAMRNLPALALALAFGATPAAAAPRYFVVVRGVDEALGVKSGIADEARQLFIAELKKHPELTLEAPPGLPDDPAAMAAALKQRGLHAYEMTLKLLSVGQQLRPPPPGKQYRVLERKIQLSVFGDTLPEKKLAIGGDGESEIAAEIGPSADLDKEGQKLLVECAKVAVAQAVDMTIAKLKHAEHPARAKKPK
jgi:hypothetical protein